MEDLEFAKDKIIMGPERKSAVLSEETRRLTSYHEAGHALVAFFTEGAMPVHKITILPRGSSGGATHFIPDESSDSYSRTRLMARMDSLMGGRIAEELIYGPELFTTGASMDAKMATNLAQKMVQEFVMGEGKTRLHSMASISEQEYPFLSNEAKQAVDDDMQLLISSSYKRSKSLLTSKQDLLHRLANALYTHETLSGEDMQRVLRGEAPLKQKIEGQKRNTFL
jgi:ATP-dependent metalloprotease